MASAAVDVLTERARKTGVPVYAYCVMPDHIHLFLGPTAHCNITTFVGQYKNLVQRKAWDQGFHGSLWQTSFWDHFVRADEDLGQTIKYVLNNPVRRGLVDTWRAYPFSGSLVFQLRETVE